MDRDHSQVVLDVDVVCTRGDSSLKLDSLEKEMKARYLTVRPNQYLPETPGNGKSVEYVQKT